MNEQLQLNLKELKINNDPILCKQKQLNILAWMPLKSLIADIRHIDLLNSSKKRKLDVPRNQGGKKFKSWDENQSLINN